MSWMISRSRSGAAGNACQHQVYLRALALRKFGPQHVGIALDEGKRRFQLVGGDRDEVRLALVEALDIQQGQAQLVGCILEQRLGLQCEEECRRMRERSIHFGQPRDQGFLRCVLT